jgi:N-acetylmuramoyl-L-alanine amidase
MLRRSFFSLLLVAVACARPTFTPPPVPAPVAPATTPPKPPAAAAPVVLPVRRDETAPLPPIPLVEGPVAIHVVYPSSDATAVARDSTYMIGSVGNGHATLTINGHSAAVYPNGAFVAYMAAPPVTSPDYHLVAALGADTARLEYRLKPPPERMVLPLDGKLVVDTSELAPRAASNLLLRGDERVTIRLRIPANASAEFLMGPAPDSGVRIPLVRNGEIASAPVEAGLLAIGGRIAVTRAGERVTVPVPSVRRKFDSSYPGFVRLGKGMLPSDTDAVIYGRTTPGENYKWFLLPGTVAELTGHVAGFTRVRASEDLEMWIDDADVDSLVPRPSHRITANARIRSEPLSADLIIPMTSTPAFFVEERDREMDLVMYGVTGNTDIINYPSKDSLVRVVTWEQETADRVRFKMQLTERPVGYMALWEHGNFVFRVRRAPVVDAGHPLRGRIIALDPGHPPAGATGPTSLYEGDAVLMVAFAAKAMLEAKGATVVMTRTTPDTLLLPPRRTTSRRADADAFVSIHLNSYPDGVNPFTATAGTGTYFFRTQSEPLARAVQQRLVTNMGLHDEGIFYRSLAVTVQSWMPAVLTEGAYVIIPEQEAALRTTAFQEKYAKGIVDGLEAYFRAFAH